MNIQREAIYKKRRNALFGDRLSVDINNAFISITEELVEVHRQGGDFDTFRLDSIRMIGVDPEMEPAWFKSAPLATVLATFQQQVFDIYDHKRQHISDRLLPVIKDVHEKEGHRYKRIVVPYAEGSLGQLNISANMEEAIASNGKSIMHDVEKVATLALIDDAWKEHLRNVDDLKDSVQGASFEQKDPLVIYKMEAYNLFEALIGHINTSVTGFLLRGTLTLASDEEMQRAQQSAQVDNARRAQANRLRAANSGGQEMTEAQKAAQRAAMSAGHNAPQRPQPIVKQQMVGRNEPCPCGSGKKYKQCHGKE
jgi:preprotein translocase subunit SecA